METFEVVLLVLAAALLLKALADRASVPSPVVLAFGGAAVALVPGFPSLDVEPSLVLALFVAPILLDAAYEISLRDLRRTWLPVACLVVVAVGATTIAVAAVAKAMVPDLPWAAAIALGAIVAPPDAASAIAILRQVRLPQTIVTILEGESLLNDASALLVYRLAVGVAVGANLDAGTLAQAVGLGIFGSVIVGFALAWLYGRISTRVTDMPTSIILQFLSTFGVWILAERTGLSPIVTVVAFGITLARGAPAHVPAAMRIPSYAVWQTAVLILNVFAFVLIGLQLRPVMMEQSGAAVQQYLNVAALVLATAMATRISWVFLYSVVARAWIDHRPAGAPEARVRPTAKGTVVIAWCGMRGIVTLATALALPPAMPHRDLILVCAFVVVLGTLAIQGVTLKPLIRLMRLPADTSIAREVDLAWSELSGEAERYLAASGNPNAARFAAMLTAPGERRAVPGSMLAGALARQRAALIRLRSDGSIGDAAFRRVEEDLDWSEVAAQRRSTPR